LNGPQLIESAIHWLLKHQPFTTLPLDSAGQRAIYKSCDSPDGGWVGSVTTKVLPCVLIECTDCNPWPTIRHARKRKAAVMLGVKTHRDDEGHEAHDARCAEVFSFCQDSQFKVYLSDYPVQSFTAIDVKFGSETLAKTGRRLESSIQMEIIFSDGELT